MDNKNTYQALAERFSLFLAFLSISAIDFAREIGESRSEKIKRVLKGEGAPSLDMVERIKSTYPDLNLNWLINGQGEMIEETIPTGSGKIITFKSSAQNSIIPFVGPGEHKDYVANLEDPIYLSGLPIYDDLKYIDSVYRDFAIHSDKNTPELYPGDIMRARWVDPEILPEGFRSYMVLVLKNGIHIGKGSVKSNRVISLDFINITYQKKDFLIPEILELWLGVEVRQFTKALKL